MPVWLIVLLVLVGVGVVVGLCYVLYRYGYKKADLTATILGASSLLFGSLSSLFKDKEGKTDLHDAMLALSDVSNIGAIILVKRKEGVAFEDMREDIAVEVKKVLEKFPEARKEVSDELVEKEVNVVIDFLNTFTGKNK